MHIVEVKSRKDQQDFLLLPVDLYKTDPNWIRPLDKDIEAVFEDYGLYIQNKKGLIRFDNVFENVKEVSMGHFIVACELLEIKLEMTDFCKLMCNGNTLIFK